MKNKPAIIAHAQWHYVPDFLPADVADRLLDWLLHSCDWYEETIRMFGRRVVVPRLVSHCGAKGVSYRYSGITHRATGWPEELMWLVPRIGALLGQTPDFLLINRYRDGADYMGWHRDDEPMAGAKVATLSLGSARRFLIEGAAGAASHRLELEHGSVLVLDRCSRHSLPKTRKPVAERVSLSFRVIR
ncbi:MAG: alpha-ketoglutarate-dependent dioxygenase AlkB [Pseudomonadales bacterium]|nr:alpha-ketoglutarate-dependent dioxygenase AlkB [Pseudomonadales bacterium]